MICPKCAEPIIWGNDFDFDDYGMEGEGIIGNYTCVSDNCDVDVVVIHTPIN